MWWSDVMTSCHDVTKPDLPISACICARKLILFLFPWFFRSMSSKMLLIFYLCDDVTSWRHVMTSQNLIYLSQLVDVLESWFFFCFQGFLGNGLQNVIVSSLVWWRDVMSSCHDVTNTDLPISACRWARELILFLFLWFFRSLSLKILIFNFVDVLASWRHVMTSRQYLSSPYSTYWSCSWAIVRFLYTFYANLRCWYQTNHRYWFC